MKPSHRNSGTPELVTVNLSICKSHLEALTQEAKARKIPFETLVNEVFRQFLQSKMRESLMDIHGS